MVPLSCQRIKPEESKALLGARQVGAILADKNLPLHGQLTVEVGDSDYSQPAYLAANRAHEHLISLVNCRGKRTLYRQNECSASQTGGAPGHYGAPFNLKNPSSWHEPDAESRLLFTRRWGRAYQVVIQA